MSIAHVRRRVAGRSVVAAWGERVAGPGWSNRLVWFLLRDPADGKLSLECLQPDEQTPMLSGLLSISDELTQTMTLHVKAALAKKRKESTR